MTDAAVKNLEKSLLLEAVRLTYGSTEIFNELDVVKVSASDHSNFEHAYSLKELNIHQLTIEGTIKWNYSYKYRFGARLVESASEDDKTNQIVIMATFDASYYTQNELTKDELTSFGKSEVKRHVWPYWREYLQSTIARLGLPFDFPLLEYYPGDESDRV
tara:strand:- start:149 stop:628 length:480 start_codon:yes stop_codon:yes gene_type:complete